MRFLLLGLCLFDLSVTRDVNVFFPICLLGAQKVYAWVYCTKKGRGGLVYKSGWLVEVGSVMVMIVLISAWTYGLLFHCGMSIHTRFNLPMPYELKIAIAHLSLVSL